MLSLPSTQDELPPIDAANDTAAATNASPSASSDAAEIAVADAEVGAAGDDVNDEPKQQTYKSAVSV